MSKIVTEFIFRSHDNGFVERRARVLRIDKDGREEEIDGRLSKGEAAAVIRALSQVGIKK